jgi:hypothetical protein
MARLARARERALSGSDVPEIRPQVLDSWARLAGAGVDPERNLPHVPLGPREVRDLRGAHPLAPVWRVLVGALRDALAAPGHVVFLADADGHLLWVDGDQATLRRAENAHLVPGAFWSEPSAGTNGVGTALALARPFRVFGPEHYLSLATGYACSAAPIRDRHGRPVGAVDVTSDVRRTRADTLPPVMLAARLGEALLRERAQRHLARLEARYAERLWRSAGTRSGIVTPDGDVVRSNPAGWLPSRLHARLEEGDTRLPDGRRVLVERLAPGGPLLVVERPEARPAPVELAALGRDRAWLRVDGVAHELSRRHSELLALIAGAPGGMTGRALAHAVHGARGRPATVRAELARLRRLLGYRIASGPYRFTVAVRADFVDLERDAGALPIRELLDRYPGPLLPGSRAPGIVARRASLHDRVRARVLAAADPDALRRWLARR